MYEHFKRSMFFVFFSMFLVGGGYAMYISENSQNIRPVFVGVLCFGAAYMMSIGWKGMSYKIMTLGASTVVGLGFVAAEPYILSWLTVYLDGGFEFAFLPVWLGLIFLVGFPIMFIGHLIFEE